MAKSADAQPIKAENDAAPMERNWVTVATIGLHKSPVSDAMLDNRPPDRFIAALRGI